MPDESIIEPQYSTCTHSVENPPLSDRGATAVSEKTTCCPALPVTFDEVRSNWPAPSPTVSKLQAGGGGTVGTGSGDGSCVGSGDGDSVGTGEGVSEVTGGENVGLGSTTPSASITNGGTRASFWVGLSIPRSSPGLCAGTL